MPLPVWLSFAFFLVVTTVSFVSLFRTGVRSWRTFRSFGETVDDRLGGMAASAERLNATQAALEAELPRLEAARERLRVTLARTAVIRTALQDVQDWLRSITVFYPRK